MSTRLVVTCAFLSLAACGGSTPAPSTGASPATPAPAQTRTATTRRNANLITQDEIATLAGRAETGLEIVEQLRPAMLRPRGGTTSGAEPIASYVDGVKVGDVQGLRSIQFAMIKEIRYYSPTDATQRFGTGHSSGAIEIVTKR